MNIEADKPTIEELESSFRFNDAVIRHLILHKDEAITEISPMMKGQEETRDDSPQRPERVEDFQEETFVEE
jgi:small subunit ribosomal protein S6